MTTTQIEYEEIREGLSVSFVPESPEVETPALVVKFTDSEVTQLFSEQYTTVVPPDVMEQLCLGKQLFYVFGNREDFENLADILDNFSDGVFSSSKTFASIVKYMAQQSGLQKLNEDSTTYDRVELDPYDIFEEHQTCLWNSHVQVTMVRLAGSEDEGLSIVLLFLPLSEEGVSLLNSTFQELGEELFKDNPFSVRCICPIPYCTEVLPLWEIFAEAWGVSVNALCNGEAIPFMDEWPSVSMLH